MSSVTKEKTMSQNEDTTVRCRFGETSDDSSDVLSENVENEHATIIRNRCYGETSDDSVDLSVSTTKTNEKPLDAIRLLMKRKMEEDNMRKQQKKTIEHLNIRVPFKVPLIHTIETRTTAALTQKQIQTLKHLKIEYKSGPYTKKEDETIKSNWKEFCRVHNLDENNAGPFLQITNISKNEDRLRFLRCLGRNLNDRLLHSIYKRFQLLFTRLKKGRFSCKESDLIKTFVESTRVKHKFASLAKILHRDRLAIEKRHMKLKYEEGKRIVWTQQSTASFLQNLLQITALKNYKDLKEIEINPTTWRQMEERLCLPVQKLEHVWINKIYPQLFLKRSMHSIKVNVIERLYHLNVSNWKDINWDEMAADYEGCSGQFLHELIKSLINKTVDKKIRNDARKTIQYLKSRIGIATNST